MLRFDGEVFLLGTAILAPVSNSFEFMMRASAKPVNGFSKAAGLAAGARS
jgi:hypothetical protein